ncbi:MAG: hypothetical protein CK604_07110 [Curvibacter sp. PD_MW3]|nr:MAG: hypothetical protein CK604_07110 [Curvibacter sp. PD_MW3]
MNVSITKLEADLLGRVSGRKPANIEKSIKHEVGKFVGQDCPFLVDDVCSVYSDRPLSCRKHASYYTTNIACKAENLEMDAAPMVSFSGLDEALFNVSEERGHITIADIRDFFPGPSNSPMART